MADAQHLPQGRCQAGDRHLKFHETRDNLRSTPELRKAAKVNAVAGFLLFVYVWLVVAGYDVWALLLLIATGAWLVWRLWRTKR